MSTTPEPMTDERLATIQGTMERYADAIPSNCGTLVSVYVSDVGSLLAEVHRLKDKYEGHAPKCHGGHENNLPLALWDCPIHTQELRDELKAAQDLLLERARENAELLAELERTRSPLVTREGDSVKTFEQVIKERDQATTLNSRLMDGLAQIHDHAMREHGREWEIYYGLAEDTIGAVGQLELDLHRARRAVVVAAKEFAQHCYIGSPVDPLKVESPLFVAGEVLKGTVQTLEKLEARR